MDKTLSGKLSSFLFVLVKLNIWFSMLPFAVFWIVSFRLTRNELVANLQRESVKKKKKKEIALGNAVKCCLCSLFFSSFPLDKNQYSFLLVRGCKATAGVDSPVQTDEEGKRTDYLGLIFSQIFRGMWYYSISICYLVLCPLLNRLEAAEFLMQVDWFWVFFACSLESIWKGL